MSRYLAALLFDLGDTIMLEETEVKDDQGTTLHAELVPGMAEALRQFKAQGHRLALVADARPLTDAEQPGYTVTSAQELIRLIAHLAQDEGRIT